MKVNSGRLYFVKLLILSLITGISTFCKTPEHKTFESDDTLSLVEEAVPQKTIYHLDMETLVEQTEDVFLSDLVYSIKYIPLETIPEYMIGEKTVKVRPCAEFIFVSEHGKPIGVFDLQGKFVRTIGTIGRGPGEYNFDYIFWPDESRRTIYVSNTNVKGISSYSFEGQFLGNIQPETQSMAFAPLGNDKFISWTWRQQTFDDKLFRIFFHNGQGEIYSRVYEPEKEYDFSHGISIMSPLFTSAPNGALYNSWEDDQINRATADGRFESCLSWSLGKLKMPFNPSSDYNRYNREKHKYVRDMNAWESEQNWYIQYYYKKGLELAVLNKETEEFYTVANQDTVQKGVFNDIDGGPSFWPYWYSDKGKRFFSLIQTFDLLEGDLRKNRKLEIKNPKAAKELQDLVSSLNENSNPVLMIVEMK